MKIRLICVGKMKNAALRALAEDYAERIPRFSPLEIVEVRDGKASDPIARLAEEAKLITAALEKGSGFQNAVLWDERGEALDTAGFSRFVDKALHKGASLEFVIGSSHGVDPELKKKIPVHLKLSGFTMTHEWARALSLEQIYRAFCVLKNFPYHH
jgi:23S rRNA (pseudouridine1915-N3)-methyltransferase